MDNIRLEAAMKAIKKTEKKLWADKASSCPWLTDHGECSALINDEQRSDMCHIENCAPWYFGRK